MTRRRGPLGLLVAVGLTTAGTIGVRGRRRSLPGAGLDAGRYRRQPGTSRDIRVPTRRLEQRRSLGKPSRRAGLAVGASQLLRVDDVDHDVELAEASEDPADLVAKLDDALDRVESMTVRINKTNNATRLGFDGRDLSIMEAVALRDRLVMEARIRRGVVDAIDVGLEIKPGRQAQYYATAERRSKDDIRKIVAIDYKAARSAADDVSERVRRLDIALQQQNWSVDLVG